MTDTEVPRKDLEDAKKDLEDAKKELSQRRAEYEALMLRLRREGRLSAWCDDV